VFLQTTKNNQRKNPRLVLENGKTVRLIGADTPETVHPMRPEQPFGKLASDYTTEIIKRGGNWVYLEEDGDAEDRYGRQLAMVWIIVPCRPKRA
jgi:micrococcal nuclease